MYGSEKVKYIVILVGIVRTVIRYLNHIITCFHYN